MKVTFELTAEQAEAMTRHAEMRGLTLEEWLKVLVEAFTPRPPIEACPEIDPEWRSDRNNTASPLPDEAFSRENIY